MIAIDMMPIIDPTPRQVQKARRLTESEWMRLDAPALALACFELTRLTPSELKHLDSLPSREIYRWVCSETSLKRAMTIKKAAQGSITILRKEAARSVRLPYTEIDVLSKRDMVAYLRWIRPKLVESDRPVSELLQSAMHTAHDFASRTSTTMKELYITHIAGCA